MLHTDNDIAIQFEEPLWLKDEDEQWWQKYIEQIIKKTFQYIHWQNPCEVSLVFTNDDTIQQLNKTYRHQDKPTNVLSFPNCEAEMLQQLQSKTEVIILGDIVLAFETVLKESEEQHKNFHHHVSHLIVHGILHLFGYDHETEQEATHMEALEINILQELGINNPYIL